jgi:hypothetical protein
MVHPPLDLKGGEEQNDAFGRRNATSYLDEQATRQSELEWETGKTYFGTYGQSGSLEGSHFGDGRREAARVAQACFGMCEAQQVRLRRYPIVLRWRVWTRKRAEVQVPGRWRCRESGPGHIEPATGNFGERKRVSVRAGRLGEQRRHRGDAV